MPTLHQLREAHREAVWVIYCSSFIEAYDLRSKLEKDGRAPRVLMPEDLAIGHSSVGTVHLVAHQISTGAVDTVLLVGPALLYGWHMPVQTDKPIKVTSMHPLSLAQARQVEGRVYHKGDRDAMRYAFTGPYRKVYRVEHRPWWRKALCWLGLHHWSEADPGVYGPLSYSRALQAPDHCRYCSHVRSKSEPKMFNLS